MNENWKPIEGYETMYQVSNLGRVRSIAGLRPCVLKQRYDRGGYMRVNLAQDGRKTTHKVHRLVALAFVPIVQGKNQVNHIDADKTNNKASNLEWVTQKENNNSGTHNKQIQQTKGTPVIQYSSAGDVVAFYFSIKEAARITSVSEWKISKAIKNGGGTIGGFYWAKGYK